MKLKFKYLIVVFLLIILSSCAGADRPYIVGTDPGTTDPGGSLPPGGGGGISNEGCKVTLNSVFTLKVKLNPTDSPENTDATGLLVTDPRELPPIILHFSGNSVTMYGDEFEVATFQLGTYEVKLRQKAGTKATGTYDEAGNITLNGVVFEMLAPKPTTFSTFTLTTGKTSDIVGAGGSLSEQGLPISADKKVTLVGGFLVSDLTTPYDGKALTVNISGTLDKIPVPKDCVGGSGGGVSLKVITKDKDKEVETPLAADGTLIMGNVFIPEQGVDPENSNSLAFKKTKVLRIQNNTASAITTNFNNSPNFSYSPSSINIAPDKSQDVTITFSSPAKAYTPNDPAPSTGISQSHSLGNQELNVTGVLKKAAPELSVDLGDSTTPGVIDLGFNPVKVLGNGASTRIACSHDYQPNVLGRSVKVMNTGVRPLEIKSIPEIVMDDPNDLKTDPYCPSFGQKFRRMGLSTMGNATCQMLLKNGHKYITDHCTIPPFQASSLEEVSDYLRFKVVYIPKNAKSMISNAKDTAKLSMITDDPSYLEKPLSVAVQAGLSKDTSDLIGISRVNNAKTSNFRIGNGQRVNLNIPEAASNEFTQIFAIKNGGSDTLQKVKMSFSDDLDKKKFQLCKASVSSVDSASCAYANSDIVSQVPPMTTVEGEAYFAIKFISNEPSDQSKKYVGPYRQSLKIIYEPSGAPGAVNEFNIGIGGTKGYEKLAGNVQMKVDFLGSYVASTVLKGDSTDSVDFRDPGFNTVKSGSLKLNLTPADDEGDLMYVKIFNEKSWEDPNFKVESITNAQERRKIIRLPSDSVMSCGGSREAPDSSASGLKKGCEKDKQNTVLRMCHEPERIDGSYQSWDCAYFYYILKNSTNPQAPENDPNAGIKAGMFNNETGEMTIPEVLLHVMNPYHGGVFEGNDYGATLGGNSQFKTDTVLKATATTSLLSVYTSNGINYAPAGADKIPSLSIEASDLIKFDACPDAWDPTISFDPQKPTLSPTPTFMCYVAPRTSPNSSGFLRGMPAVPAPDGERAITLAFVTRFNNQTGSPEYIPFFMNDSVMWIAFQGRLKQCKADWSDCSD